ncbi:STAS domain-containing protein [Chondromyces apiculatus]|uniref:RsbR, positive regulator of sigma-B n=1 Tax=Chondromyces apiculatus DSM 436 TaxID=1192034 RepID=A0A017SYS9_9BACT|nr:STAS domain-containing protein [Chondromyces apiculatus]EYF01932.1 RsbR, positive regulator of sigma-B [Chondromyces apiculatus DSM 436]
MTSTHEILFDLSIGLLVTINIDGYFVDLNPAWTETLGWDLDELRSTQFFNFVHADDQELTKQEAAKLVEGHKTIHFENRYRHKDGSYRWLVWMASADMSAPAADRLIFGTAYDITGLKESQARLERALQETRALESELRLQRDRLRTAVESMATPLIPITDSVVVMPLVGQMDAERVGRVMDAALEGIQAHRAAVVILDVTGLPEIDSQVASALVSTAQALRLLGAETLLTGVRPAAAQTLVGLGLDLSGISTYGTLQAAIASALRDPVQKRAARR